MAGEEGLEPPTPGFGDRCSNQLSYTPMRLLLTHRAVRRKAGAEAARASRRAQVGDWMTIDSTLAPLAALVNLCPKRRVG